MSDGDDDDDDEPLYVDCAPHGKRVAAVVCCHMLQSREPVGVIENSSDPNDLQAWCELCEEMSWPKATRPTPLKRSTTGPSCAVFATRRSNANTSGKRSAEPGVARDRREPDGRRRASALLFRFARAQS